MLKYAKIEDLQTKICTVAEGDDIQFFKSIGMELIDVEKGCDQNWYVKGFCPSVFEVLSTEQITQRFENDVDIILNDKARQYHYDSILSVCSYVDSGVEKFDKEGLAFRRWRSAVWDQGYQLLQQMIVEKSDYPSLEQLVEMLPKLELE